MYPKFLAAPAALAAALLACSDVPSGLESLPNSVSRAAGDTAGAGLPASVQVTGRVLGVSATGPVAGSTDTLQFAPVAHARVVVMRNILVNGHSGQERAAELRADQDGRFVLDLTGGYYVVEASAPGSGYQAGWEYLPATRSAVEVSVYLWQE